MPKHVAPVTPSEQLLGNRGQSLAMTSACGTNPEIPTKTWAVFFEGAAPPKKREEKNQRGGLPVSV